MVGPIRPFSSVLALVQGRASWSDLGAALTSRIELEAPKLEDPDVQLESWCFDHQVGLVDFRDLKLWKRDRNYNTHIYGYPSNKKRGSPYGSRTWAQTTCFMFHTTAVAGMEAGRGLGIPCHLYLPKEPAIVLAHQMTRLVPHGHAGNRYCVGCEVSGESDWDSDQSGVGSQIERARALLRYFQAMRFLHVGEGAPCYVSAHCQTHWSRKNDCGPPIWRDAGEWAIDVLGFRLGPVVGSGTEIPVGWRAA